MVFISNVAAFCVFMATVIFSWGSIECSATGQLVRHATRAACFVSLPPGYSRAARR